MHVFFYVQFMYVLLIMAHFNVLFEAAVCLCAEVCVVAVNADVTN